MAGRIPMHIRRTVFTIRGERISLAFCTVLADTHPEAGESPPAPPTPAKFTFDLRGRRPYRWERKRADFGISLL
jgi:hypothetical protein